MKYSLKIAASLVKLKKTFVDIQLESLEMHPDEWTAELKSLQNEIDKISVSAKVSNEDYMIHALNNLTKENDVVLEGMESRLILKENSSNKLTIKDFRDTLSCKPHGWTNH